MHDWPKAEESLSRVNGLGNMKHRKQVKNLYDEVKVTLAECLLDCACQVPFSQKDTLSVIQFLKNNCQHTQLTATNQQNNQLTQQQMFTNYQLPPSNSNKIAPIETSHLYLLMALLYSFDCSYLEIKEQG